jgi:hypothetical protein
MNASFQVGLSYLNNHQKRALGALIPPENFFRKELLREAPNQTISSGTA